MHPGRGVTSPLLFSAVHARAGTVLPAGRDSPVESDVFLLKAVASLRHAPRVSVGGGVFTPVVRASAASRSHSVRAWPRRAYTLAR
jgi:hypothetical protein